MELLNLGDPKPLNIQIERGFDQVLQKLEPLTEEQKIACEEKRYLKEESELAKSDDIFEVLKSKECQTGNNTTKNRRVAKEAMKVEFNPLNIVSNPIEVEIF